MYVSIESVGLFVTIFGGIIAYLTLKRSNKQDIIQTTKDNVIISTKLDMVLTSLNDVVKKLNTHDNKFTDIEIKLTQALESSASAHKRIDEMIGAK